MTMIDPRAYAEAVLASVKAIAELKRDETAAPTRPATPSCRYCACLGTTMSYSGCCVCEAPCGPIGCPMVEGDRYFDGKIPCPIFDPQRLPIGRVEPGRTVDTDGRSFDPTIEPHAHSYRTKEGNE